MTRIHAIPPGADSKSLWRHGYKISLPARVQKNPQGTGGKLSPATDTKPSSWYGCEISQSVQTHHCRPNRCAPGTNTKWSSRPLPVFPGSHGSRLQAMRLLHSKTSRFLGARVPNFLAPQLFQLRSSPASTFRNVQRFQNSAFPQNRFLDFCGHRSLSPTCLVSQVSGIPAFQDPKFPGG